jgi:hypothetical protein
MQNHEHEERFRFPDEKEKPEELQIEIEGEGGTEIEVVDGKVDKINMGDMTKDEEIEEKKEKEDTKDESMSEVELEFGDVKLKDGGIIRIGGDEPSVGLLVKKVDYDGTLSAVADGEYETDGGKIISIVGGSIQGYQSKSDVNPKTTQEFTEAKTADGAIVESPTFDVGEKIDVVNAGKEVTYDTKGIELYGQDANESFDYQIVDKESGLTKQVTRDEFITAGVEKAMRADRKSLMTFDNANKKIIAKFESFNNTKR